MRSQDEATEDLRSLFNAIFESVTEGARDYYRDHTAAANAKHRSSTRRSVMRDYIVYRLRGAIGAVKGVEIFDKNQTTYFGINSRWLGRVHKVGRDMTAAVNSTNKSLAFQENNAAVALGPELAEATCVRVAYSPQVNDPMNPSVYLVCPNATAKGYEWVIPILPEASAGIVAGPGSVPGGPGPTAPDNLDPVIDVIERPEKRSNE